MVGNYSLERVVLADQCSRTNQDKCSDINHCPVTWNTRPHRLIVLRAPLNAAASGLARSIPPPPQDQFTLHSTLLEKNEDLSHLPKDVPCFKYVPSEAVSSTNERLFCMEILLLNTCLFFFFKQEGGAKGRVPECAGSSDTICNTVVYNKKCKFGLCLSFWQNS